MITQELINYISEQLKQGVEKEKIKNDLISAGWQTSDIEEAFNNITSAGNEKKPQSFSESDAVSQSQNKASFELNNSEYPDTSWQKTLKKTLVLFILVISTALAAVGGVFAYRYYFPSPEDVIIKMMEKLAEINSVEFAGDVKIEFGTTIPKAGNILKNKYLNKIFPASIIMGLVSPSNFDYLKELPPPGQDKIAISLNFNGISDISDPNNQKSSFSILLNADLNLGFEIEFNIRNLGIDMKTVGKINYIKLNNIPKFPFFDTDSIENQWIKINIESLEETFEKEFGQELFGEDIKSIQKQQELSPEQIEKIREIVKKYKFLKITDILTSEKIEGKNAYHYKFIIDKKEIKNLYLEVMKIILKKPASEILDSESIDKIIGQTFDKFEMMEGEIWIGKNDFMPYKIFFTSNFKDAESKFFANISSNLNFKNFNKPARIEIPSSAKPIEEILKKILEPSISEASVKARDARRIADIRQLQIALEMYYDYNSKYPKDLQSLATYKFKSGIAIMPEIQEDPLTSVPYSYYLCSAGSYHLGATLELPNNAALRGDQNINSLCAGDIVDGISAAPNCGKDNKATKETDLCYDISL